MSKKRKPKNGHVHEADEPRLPVPLLRPKSREEPPDEAPPKTEPRLRRATVKRSSRDADVTLALDLDGTGRAQIDTPLPYLNRLLEGFARQSLIDLRVSASGDLDSGAHLLVEELGLSLGRAFGQALSSDEGAAVACWGESAYPVRDTLVRCHVDFSGRPTFVWRVAMPTGTVGNFDVEHAEVLLRAFSVGSGATLHLNLEYGGGKTTILEACFAALGRALGHATTRDARRASVSKSHAAEGELSP